MDNYNANKSWSQIWLQKILTFFILSAIFLFQIYISLSAGRILEHAVNDDTFYYLEVAYRAANGEGFTFDGINKTNGFQPAWGVLLTVVAWFINSIITFLRTAVIIAALFNLCTGILIFRISNLILDEKILVIPVLVWSSTQLAPSISLSALEISMNWLIFTLIAWYLVKTAQKENIDHNKMFNRDTILIGFLCALLFLTRVDNIIYIALIIFLASSLLSSSTIGLALNARVLKMAFSIGLIAFIFVTPYLLWNLYSHGGLLPVSGLIKQKVNYTDITIQMGGYFTLDTLVYSIGRVMSEMLWTLSQSLSILGGGTAFWLTNSFGFVFISLGLLSIILIVSLIKVYVSRDEVKSWHLILQSSITNWILIVVFFWLLYGAFNFISISSIKQGLKLLLIGGAILIGGLIAFFFKPSRKTRFVFSDGQEIIIWFFVPILIHLSILVYTVDYFLHYTQWYYGNYFVIIALGIGVLAEFIYSYLGLYSNQVRDVTYGLAVTWFTIGFCLSFFFAIIKISAPLPEPPYGNGNYRIAKWIDDQLPEDAIIASYNAGIIGYFSNRPTINLDGLINNRELIPYLFGPKNMTDYIETVCPDYVVDYIHLDIDPSKDFQNDDQFLGISLSILKPIHWMKSVPADDVLNTFVVFEVDKSFCTSNSITK